MSCGIVTTIITISTGNNHHHKYRHVVIL